MLIFGINTATSSAEIVLLQIFDAKSGASKFGAPPKVLKIFAKSWQSNRDEAEKVMPVLKAALKKAEVAMREATTAIVAKKSSQKPKLIDKIFVVSGPGAFTGLRIGVTVANTLAFLHNAPIINISTFDFLRAKIGKKYQSKTAILLKAGGEFAAVLLPKSKKVNRLNAGELSKFFSSHKSIKFLITDASPIERKKYPLPEKIKWLPEKSLVSITDVMLNVLAGKHMEHKIVKPQYLLPPKITQSKKEIFV